MIDVLTCSTEEIESLDSMKTQVMLKTIKQLNTDTKLFAKSIIKSETKLPLNFFAFSTFPAIFGFFTSVELCSQAALLIHDLISLNAPDSILYPMVLSFLLSLFSFTDAMWNNFYTGFSLRNHPREDEVSESLARAITECAPLINSSAFSILKELLNKRPNLYTNILLNSFIPITLHLWLQHSNNAMSFGSGQEILDFIKSIQNSQKAVMISALFVFEFGRIRVCPSYITTCHMSSEILFFSHIDVKLFVDAFRPIASEIQLFEVLEQASRECSGYRFLPFSIGFFLSDMFITESSEKFELFDFPQTNGLEEPEADPIYESAQHALAENPKLESPIFTSDGFREYSLRKDIIFYKELAEAQDDLITLKLEEKLAIDYRFSLLTLRQYVFSEYFSKFLPTFEKNQEQIEAKTMDALFGNDDKKLILPAFIEVINSSKMQYFTVPNLLHRMYLTITRSCIEENWRNADRVGRTQFTLRLVPLLSKRKKLKIGEYFYLLDNILADIRIICNYFYPKEEVEEGMITLITTVLHSANTESLLDIFLYYEKIAFRDPKFLSALSFYQSKNWNLFFQMMWKTLEKDKTLIQQCMVLDALKLSEIMRGEYKM